MSTRCEGRVGMTRYNFRSLSSQVRTVVASCLSLGSTTDEIRGKRHGSEASGVRNIRYDNGANHCKTRLRRGTLETLPSYSRRGYPAALSTCTRCQQPTLLPEHCTSVERGRWHVRHSARWRGVDRESVLSPPLPGAGAPAKPQSRRRYFAVPDHTGGAHTHDFRACRVCHCQVVALPQSHSPEGGTLRCQITPGVPTPRLQGLSCPPLPGAGAPAKPQSRRRYFAVPDHTGVPTARLLGVCGRTCEWIQAAPCAGVTMWVAVEDAGVVATVGTWRLATAPTNELNLLFISSTK